MRTDDDTKLLRLRSIEHELEELMLASGVRSRLPTAQDYAAALLAEIKRTGRVASGR